ncbi:MAG: carbohydrate binding domain-containing protein [Planctomycetota bacterium]
MFRRLAYLVSFVLVLIAVPVVTHAQVENLMHTDPSFEDEIIIVSPGWATWTTWGGGGSVEIDTTDFIDGAKSLRVNQTSGQFNVIAAAIPMTPGDRYTCSFWAKADAPRPISVRFQSMNNSGFVAGDFDLTTEWAEYTFTEEAPNPNNNIKLQFITNDALGISYWLDFVSCYAGEYVAQSKPSGWSQVNAADPDPADGAADVPRDVVLSWTPGDYADVHNVYFGASFDDVNNATLTVDLTGVYRGLLSDSSYAVSERLDFGKTYYWRVDEVNAPPDSTVFKGNVWSFTAEPVGYAIDGANITATASSSMAGTAPEKSIDGSGLDESVRQGLQTPRDVGVEPESDYRAVNRLRIERCYHRIFG